MRVGLVRDHSPGSTSWTATAGWAHAHLVEQALHDAGFTEVGVPWRSGTGGMVAAVR
jgi:hypothetical protein